MKQVKEQVWGELGAICGIVYTGIGVYYAVTSTVGEKGIKFVVGFAILSGAYVLIKRNKASSTEQ